MLTTILVFYVFCAPVERQSTTDEQTDRQTDSYCGPSQTVAQKIKTATRF